MLGSIAKGITGAVSGVAGDVLGNLDLDAETLFGLGVGIAIGDPMLTARGIADVVDGKEDKLVQTFDQYAGLTNPFGNPLGAGQNPTGYSPTDFAINIFV